ncbi:hypothetical protein GQ53DRAFT_748143 [Thozetella sp. PMI_491]|nr:hypothetical protein GQ53DRAFT_748143 [Thozetella sp. PMI_491]
MKRFSILLAIIIGIGSTVLFKQHILDLATYTASLLLEKASIINTFTATTGTASSVSPQEASTSDADPFLTSHKLDIPPDTHLIVTNMSVPRAIRKVFLAVEQSEGMGARVRRSIGTPQLRNFSPFLMLDHFSVKPGAGSIVLNDIKASSDTG